MEAGNSINVSAILAVVCFILPITYKQNIELSDLTKCTLAAMTLPDLAIILFYVIINQTNSIDLQKAGQYLTVAVLIIGYLAIKEIKNIFERRKEGSRKNTAPNEPPSSAG